MRRSYAKRSHATNFGVICTPRSSVDSNEISSIISYESKPRSIILYVCDSLVKGDKENNIPPIPVEIVKIIVDYAISSCNVETCEALTFTKFCLNHTCKKDGCNNKTRQRKDVYDIYDVYCESCISDMCCYSGCFAKRCLEKDSSKFCEIHTCFVKGCNLRVKSKPAKIFGKACISHSCKNSECLNVSQDSIVCAKHWCRYKGCRNATFFNKLCKEHTCSVSNCFKMTSHKSKYCDVHACTSRNCKSKRLRSKFCEEHICQSIYICSSQRREEYSFCEDHLCKTEECANEKMVDMDYCKEHLCSYKGCPKHINVLCNHQCVKCHRPERTLNLKLCKVHSCNFGNCTNYLDESCPSKFCENHQCKYKSKICKNSISHEGDDYCSVHKCSYCNESIKEGNAFTCEKH